MNRYTFQSEPGDALAPKIQDIHGASQHMIQCMEQLFLHQERWFKQLQSQMEAFRDEITDRQMKMQLEIERLKLNQRLETEKRKPEDDLTPANKRIKTLLGLPRGTKGDSAMTQIVYKPVPSAALPPESLLKTALKDINLPAGLTLSMADNKTKKVISGPMGKVASPPAISDAVALEMTNPDSPPPLEPKEEADPLALEGEADLASHGKEEDLIESDYQMPCQSMSELDRFMKDALKVKQLTTELRKMEPSDVIKSTFTKVVASSLWPRVELAKRRDTSLPFPGLDSKMCLPWSFVDWTGSLYRVTCIHKGLQEPTAIVCQQKILDFLAEQKRDFNQNMRSKDVPTVDMRKTYVVEI